MMMEGFSTSFFFSFSFYDLSFFPVLYYSLHSLEPEIPVKRGPESSFTGEGEIRLQSLSLPKEGEWKMRLDRPVFLVSTAHLNGKKRNLLLLACDRGTYIKNNKKENPQKQKRYGESLNKKKEKRGNERTRKKKNKNAPIKKTRIGKRKREREKTEPNLKKSIWPALYNRWVRVASPTGTKAGVTLPPRLPVSPLPAVPPVAPLPVAAPATHMHKKRKKER